MNEGMIKISENLYQLSGSSYLFIFPEYEDLGNSLIVTTDEGVVVLDTDVRTVDRLFTVLPQLSSKPVRFLVNSHHAFDHTSANCVFAGKGVTIIASKKCREEMIKHSENDFRRWSAMKPYLKRLLEEKGITVALPHITFNRELQLNLGGETFELYHYGHGHTPGDIIVYLPKDRILFGGDLIWCGFFPNVREGNVPNYIRIVDRILEFPAKHYIPGHGYVTSDPEEIRRMKDFLEFLWKTIEKGVREGKGLEELLPLKKSMIKDHPEWRGEEYLDIAFGVIYKTLRSETK